MVVLIKTQGSDRTPSLLLFQFRQNANDRGRVRMGWAGGRRERGKRMGKALEKDKGDRFSRGL